MARYYHTPSVWPAYGRVVSGFGYRVSPWRGFHTGIDITCWYGSPIRAAAAGVITHAGWLGGYGIAVKIDHGYGVETLYGHNSRLEVSYGSRVRKGQIIAYSGSTGFSTGPHCHYEVRKSGNPINPWSYLNLDVFTASRIWHGAR
ncbi:MAG: M23 family metallopeptidase [Candidatus Saganbacteria bacterium]|nr:M23 family metallopeptidase [Candidatus Saganbacteria bacterium]